MQTPPTMRRNGPSVSTNDVAPKMIRSIAAADAGDTELSELSVTDNYPYYSHPITTCLRLCHALLVAMLEGIESPHRASPLSRGRSIRRP